MKSEMSDADANVRRIAEKAREAYLELLRCTEEDKNAALQCVVEGLARRSRDMIEANREDLAAADALVASGRLTPALRSRLVLDERKLAALRAGVQQVIRLPDPSGRVLSQMELDRDLVLQRRSCPLGVIGVIFESRPDVVVQVSSLLLKAGNAGILKGGTEAQNSNACLMEVLRDSLERSGRVPVDALQLISTREQVRALLDESERVDLLIPRGGKDFVRSIQNSTRIPVLGHADGVCHVYIHQAADREKALRVTVDAKTEYPAVCNAAETILMDAAVASDLLPPLVLALQEKSVEVRGCERARALSPALVPAAEDDWRAEYLDLVVSVKLVDGAEQAIAHINRYGSHHTDAIVTEDSAVADAFCRFVDSSSVLVNASTRFADGFRYGLGAEIGISTQKIHARGPVGLDGVVTYKYELRGDGHVVSDYGPGKRAFTHRRS